jgi:hypothetical protein
MAVEPWAALMAAAGTFVGAVGMAVTNRRTGKLSMNDHQLKYIQEQQEDIAALRADLADLWDWVNGAIRKAGEHKIDLGPLPQSRPKSKTPAGSTETGA